MRRIHSVQLMDRVVYVTDDTDDHTEKVMKIIDPVIRRYKLHVFGTEDREISVGSQVSVLAGFRFLMGDISPEDAVRNAMEHYPELPVRAQSGTKLLSEFRDVNSVPFKEFAESLNKHTDRNLERLIEELAIEEAFTKEVTA